VTFNRINLTIKPIGVRKRAAETELSRPVAQLTVGFGGCEPSLEIFLRFLQILRRKKIVYLDDAKWLIDMKMNIIRIIIDNNDNMTIWNVL
jgi:hypothetical protein